MSGRMGTVRLLGGGTMTLPCPAWCDGHPDVPPLHPVDVLHESCNTELPVATGRSEVGILAFGLTQAPFGDDELPYGTVELGNVGPTRLTPAEMRALADGLVRHSNLLRQFATRVEQLQSWD